MVLLCHSSVRGVTELLRDVFDYHLSVGAVHNLLRRAVPAARDHNQGQDLSRVRIGAHDEIFQAGRPALVGCDADSTYCSLLSREEHRDGPTWAVPQFFLNRRRFLRSERPGRAGKSPAELLTGQRHGHWLELLGDTRFVRE